MVAPGVWTSVTLYDEEEFPEPGGYQLSFDGAANIPNDVSFEIDLGSNHFEILGYPHQLAEIAVFILDRLSQGDDPVLGPEVCSMLVAFVEARRVGDLLAVEEGVQ